MLKKRLIAVILVRDGQVVQSIKFKHTNVIHYDPIHAIESFNRWAVDEIVLLNVSKSKESRNEFINIVKNISTECFVPLTAGGWVDSLDYASNLISNGADKILLNTKAFEEPKLITKLSEKFGKQCIVVSIDSKKDEFNEEYVSINRGGNITSKKTIQWAKEAEKHGCGELFINSIDHDGNRKARTHT